MLGIAESPLAPQPASTGLTNVTIYTSDDDDDDEEDHPKRKSAASKEFEGLAKVDLTTPLREDEVMPERQHHVVLDRKPDGDSKRDSSKKQKKKEAKKHKEEEQKGGPGTKRRWLVWETCWIFRVSCLSRMFQMKLLPLRQRDRLACRKTEIPSTQHLTIY